MPRKLPADLTFRQLSPDDWEIFKTIRLEALQTAHGFFGPSYENNKNNSDEQWQEELTSNKNTFHAIFKDDRAVALTILSQNWDNENEVFISGVFVTPEYRGKGLTNFLFLESIKLAKSHRYKRLWCSTRNGNQAIVAVCKKFGFTYDHTVKDKLWPDGVHADLLYYRMDF